MFKNIFKHVFGPFGFLVFVGSISFLYFILMILFPSIREYFMPDEYTLRKALLGIVLGIVFMFLGVKQNKSIN